MHQLLARQLYQLCGIETAEQLAECLEELYNLPSRSRLAVLVNNLSELLDHVNATCEQNQQQLDAFLQTNEEKAASTLYQPRISNYEQLVASVRDLATKLQTSNERVEVSSTGEELDELLTLLPLLVERRQLELFNQRFAMDQHAIISITDIYGNITFVNDKFVSVSGYSREELVGKNHRIINSGTHPRDFFHTMWRTITQGQVWHGEICNRTKQGSLYWVDSTVVPLLNEAGRPKEYISIRTDITGQKMLSEKIAASEQQYRSLVENVHEVIFQMDAQGRWLFLNNAWTSITGFEVEASLGKSFLDYVHHDNLDKTLTIIQQLFDHEISAYRGELRFYNNYGGYCWFEVSVQRETLEGTDNPTFTGTLHDISERHRIAQLQSEFIAVVSHELRTPITSIRGSLSLLDASMQNLLQEPQQKLLHIAHKNSERLVSLVNDILDMEKLMAGKMSMRTDPIDLVALAELAIDANAAYAHTYEVTFALCQRPAEALVLGDANRLMQVISNLLSNAAKYSPKGRQVDIDITLDQDGAKVSVHDYGPGIPLEFRPRVFNAFAQANSSDTRRQGGTGLGLKISKTLVEKMGGSMGFDSELGVGTRFWFKLPLAERQFDEQQPNTAL